MFNDMEHVEHACDLYETVQEDSLSFEDKFEIWQRIKGCCEQIVYNNSIVMEQMLLSMPSVWNKQKFYSVHIFRCARNDI